MINDKVTYEIKTTFKVHRSQCNLKMLKGDGRVSLPSVNQVFPLNANGTNEINKVAK